MRYRPCLLQRITGVSSAEDVRFRVLAANQYPDHASIAAFRQRHLATLASLFLQVLKLCERAGLVKLGHVAINGTKINANASKHKAMSYARMTEAEKRLEAEMARLFEEAQNVDAAEDVLTIRAARSVTYPQPTKCDYSDRRQPPGSE